MKCPIEIKKDNEFSNIIIWSDLLATEQQFFFLRGATEQQMIRPNSPRQIILGPRVAVSRW
jgi:hypothetical protein